MLRMRPGGDAGIDTGSAWEQCAGAFLLCLVRNIITPLPEDSLWMPAL